MSEGDLVFSQEDTKQIGEIVAISDWGSFDGEENLKATVIFKNKGRQKIRIKYVFNLDQLTKVSNDQQ